jgi:hypothetical protein
MKLQGELADFLSSPVLLIVSAADEQGRPAIGRAMGVDVKGPDEIEMMLSRWQWPDVVRNIVSSDRLALTASRAGDYVTYQLKGRATVRETDDEVIERARLYWAAIRVWQRRAAGNQVNRNGLHSPGCAPSPWPKNPSVKAMHAPSYDLVAPASAGVLVGS